MHVTTNPPVAGSWNWIDDQTAHWRPEKYYAPGTSVDVTAEIYGTRLGDGLYGAAGRTRLLQDRELARLRRRRHDQTGQRVRQRQAGADHADVDGYGRHRDHRRQDVSLLDAAGHLHRDGQGQPGGHGLLDLRAARRSRLGYRTTVPYATRISIDGIYLHQLNATVWAQGNTNVSHGCLNLNGENARWFFDFSVPGDIVEVRNTGGPADLAQGGDWSVPWDEWRKGSALNA